MPGFLDKIKSGADKAAFEADRLVRVNQAQGAVRTAQRDLESETVALGREVMILYEAGTLAQPELLDMCRRIDGLRQQVATLEAEVERIRQEKAPLLPMPSDVEAAASMAPPAAVTPEPPAAPLSPPAVPAAQARACPKCGSPLRAGIRFCPECGTRVEGA